SSASQAASQKEIDCGTPSHPLRGQGSARADAVLSMPSIRPTVGAPNAAEKVIDVAALRNGGPSRLASEIFLVAAALLQRPCALRARSQGDLGAAMDLRRTIMPDPRGRRLFHADDRPLLDPRAARSHPHHPRLL